MRWIALGVTLFFWVITWPQILPSDRDLPPCHMMFLIGIAGAWTLFEFCKSRRARYGAGRCARCGYDLTGNVSGVCPECGAKTSSLGRSVP